MSAQLNLFLHEYKMKTMRGKNLLAGTALLPAKSQNHYKGDYKKCGSNITQIENSLQVVHISLSFLQYSRKSHQDKSHEKYCQNKIYKEFSCHYIHPFLSHRLNDQNDSVAIEPNNIKVGSYLSKTAGITTAARETKATSEEISDNFSTWRLLSSSKRYGFIIKNYYSMEGTYA